MPYNPQFGTGNRNEWGKQPAPSPRSGYHPQFGQPVHPAPVADPSDPYPIAGSSAPEAIELGRLVVNGRRANRLRYGGENHILIFGKSGTGKDTRLIIPNLLRMGGNRSIVAVDPKGEMAAVTAPRRAQFGRVVILNPFGILADYQGFEYMDGCGFNPLCALDPSSPDFNVDAGLMAEALIPITGNEKEPFFPLMARALVGGLIMYEVCKAREQGRVPMLLHVRRMLCEAAQEATPPKIIGGETMKEGTPATGIPAYALEMANSVIIGMRNKGGQFVNWNKEIHSVASTARAETEFLDDPQIAYSLAQNDFDFSEVKRRPTTVYLVLPMDVMRRHGKWLRMLLTTALRACMRPRASGEPRTLFIFNEFAALGHLQLIEDSFTVVRGAGIQMMPVLQDLNQLKQIYDKRWQTFIANADVTATFVPNDTESADWFSKRCGETSKLKTTVTENWSVNSGSSQNQGQSPNGETSGLGTSGGWAFNRSANHSYEKEPFVTPYDLYNMQPGELRIIRAGMADTFHAHALPYYDMKSIAGLAAPNPYAPYANIPRIPRQTRRYDEFQRQAFGASPPIQPNHGDSTDDFDKMFGGKSASAPTGKPTRNIFDDAFSPPSDATPGDFGWEDTPAPNGDRAPGRKPSQPPTADSINARVQSRHPSYTPDPPKGGNNPPDEGGDGWDYDDNTF